MLDLFDSTRISALFGIVVACYILRDVVRLIHTVVREALANKPKKAGN